MLLTFNMGHEYVFNDHCNVQKIEAPVRDTIPDGEAHVFFGAEKSRCAYMEECYHKAALAVHALLSC